MRGSAGRSGSCGASSVSEIKGRRNSSANIHGGVVGQDCLLLELVLLENIRLEGLLGFCDGLLSAGTFGSRLFRPSR